MAIQSVKIPVELEVQMREMSSQIDKIRQLMGKIDPNAKGFRKLENQLKGIDREFQNIKKRAGETFTTQGQINTFGRKFEHLQTMAEDFGDSLKKINFSAFTEDVFDQDILNNINTTKKEIETLEKEITKLGGKAFVNTAKASQDLVDTLKELGINSVDELVDEKKVIDSFNKIKESSRALKKELGDLDSKKNSESSQRDREALILEKKEFDLTAATQEYVKLQNATKAARKELEKFQKIQQNASTQAKKKSLSDTEVALSQLGIEKANFKTKAGRAQNGKDYFGDKGDKLDKNKLLQHLINDLSFTQEDLNRAGALSLTEQSLDAFYKNLAELLKEKKESFEQEITKIDKDVTDADAALKKAEGAESTSKDKVDAAQAQFDKQKQIVDSLSKEITDLEKRANQVQVKIERNTIAVAALEKAGKDKNTVLETAPQIQQIKELEKKIQELEEALRKSSPTGQQLQQTVNNIGKGAQRAQSPIGGMVTKLDQLNESSRRLNSIQDAIKRWFGFYEVINLTKRTIRDAINHIRELDKVMTEIAVVTDMTQQELWDQISTYSEMAQKYGATTQGVYEVSQLYYQQGLQTAEVMQLTEETLKMAKIASIDYADATDYMTVAIRGFKMEMSDAQNVVDVYSNIAAVTASDTEELAVAMSKTASSAEAVGSSFENTTAMIALMVETTREAPENIGSAMKSIISRYGEMTTNPAKLVDSEGEEMSLNKVDKALQSVGISLQDVNGQFRDFDEVILELSSKWDTIDKNTQRYIATVMAGNRQQSRFLALVGNYDRLSELYEEAANSQDAATLQTLKTMDSIETKINQLKTAFQEFYTNTGIEDLIKGVLDFTTTVIERINDIPKAFDKIPLAAVGMIGTLITTGKMGLSALIGGLFKTLDSYLPEVKVEGVKMGEAVKEGFELGIKGMGEKAQKELDISKSRAKWGTALASIGSLVSTLALTLGDLETAEGRVISGLSQIAGGAASVFGQVLTGNYIGAAITAVSTLTSAIATMEETTEEKIDRLKKNVEESSNESLLSKNELKTLTDYKKKYEELSKSQYKSAEAKQEFLDLQNEIAASYPSLISGMDDEGNYLISLGDSYERLLDLKQKNYALSLQQKQLDEISYYADPDALFEELGGNAANWDTSWWNAPIGDNSDLEKFYKSFQQEGFWTNNPDQQIYDQIKLYGQQYWGGDPNKGVAGLDTDFLKTFLAEGFFFNSYDDIVGPDGTRYENASNEQIISAITESLLNGSVVDESSPFYGLELVDSSYYSDVMTRKAAGDIQNSELVTKYIEEQAIPELIQSQLNYLGIDLDQMQLDQLTASIIEDFNADRGDISAAEYYKTFSNNMLFKDGFFQNYIDTIPEDILNANEEINAIYSKRETYSLDEYKEALQEAGASDEIINLAVEKWKEDTFDARDRFMKGFNSLKEREDGSVPFDTDGKMDRIKNEIAPYLLDSVLSQFEYAMRNIDTDEAGAEAAVNALATFYNSINELGPEAEYIAANADLTSLSGIEAMFTEMEAAGIDISGLDMSRWINTLTVNLDLEWETYSDKIAEGMKNFEEAIINASEGMDLEEAIAMANKLGVTLEDFRFEDGKYFFDNIELVIQKYRDYSDRLRDNIETETQNMRETLIPNNIGKVTFDGETFGGELDEEFQSFINSRADEYAAWLEKNREQHGSRSLSTFLNEELDELDNNTIQMIEEYEKRLTAMAYLSVENLAKFFETLELTAEEQAQILEALKTGDTSNLTGNALKIYYEYEDELTSLITSTISDMTDAALEAISSGKTQRVDITNLEKYNPDFAKDIKNGTLEGITYQEIDSQAFALIGPDVSEETYKSFLGAMNYTTEQYNEAMVSFIEASSKNYQTIFEDITSNPREVELSTVEELANILGMQINDVIQLYFQENVDGTYSVLNNKLGIMASHLEDIDPALTNLENTEELIADSLIAYTDEILGYISNGISGDLSNVEFSKLGEYIASLTDGQVSLSFEKTAEGIKLTQSSLLQIYSTLQTNNSLAAQIVLDELTESAMDADENLNNIYKVMERIAEINEELSTTEISDKREKALRAELALAENILDTLMEAGDAFNFMDQDLPTGMTNPLSAWEGMGEAFKVLDGDEFKADRIGFQDFYNMITMMGDDALAAAGIFTDDSQTAADLIEAGAAALVNIDGETFVDLSKLGTNFNLGAEGMKEGLTEGIHTLAENQIEMLDAEIALLETVVKTQEAFDSISGDDNKINLSEFNPITDRFGKAHWKPQQEVLLQTLSDYTDGVITIGKETINLAELINNPNTWGTISPEAQQKLVDYLNTIHSLTSGMDWSLSPTENFEAFKTLATQLQESSLDINWNSLIDSWTSGLDSDSAEDIKRKIIEHLGGTISEGGELKIPYNYTVEPEVQIDSTALAGLKGDVRQKIAEVVNGDGKVTEAAKKALVHLGFEVQVGDELSSDQIAALRSALNIEDKIINLTVNATNVDAEIYNLLNGTTTDIPTTITLTVENGENVQTTLSAIKDTLIELESRGYNIELAYNITTTSDNDGTYNVTLNDQGTVETLSNLAQALTNLNTQANALKDSANAITSVGPDNVKALKEQINILPDKSTEVGKTATAIDKLHDKSRPVLNTAAAIDSLKSKSITASITVKVITPNPTPNSKISSVVGLTSKAKGNIALAKGTGKAAAKGKTLMGELGPELVVSNGRYYVVGQNGAEFVDLADDAIVFNHLQTQRLLSSGSSGRGDPVTNEKKAVAFAGGNVTGPAMASAESALAELKAIRAMWQALLDQDAKSLGKKAGSGGGSGGNGGGGGSPEETAAYIHDLERWYNLLRQIEKLEEQITYEQAKRENMRNGYDYSKSLQKELELLKKQQKAYQDLSRLQKDFYDKRRQDLEKTDYSKIFTYDEDGLMQYVDGKGRGLDVLATLNATDVNGKAKMNASQQLAYLRSIGFDTSVLNTNVDGTKAENDEQRVQNFWDGIDGWMAEMDDLYDSYNEAATNIEKATAAMNEILQEQIDNQLAVEEKLMKALEAREQAEIDRIQEEKDALEEAAQEYIDGLNTALEKERSMYDKNETDAETSRLQRQLAILQRSGGSASEIKSLQDQIDSRLKEAYFEEQQNQIDAIQEASDNQLEKLQTQIDIMTEALEYQKENGLLWAEISEMMQTWTPEAMLEFIETFEPDYKTNSATQNQQNSEETLQQIEQWVGYNNDNKRQERREEAWEDYYAGLTYDEAIKEEHRESAKKTFDEAYEETENFDTAKKAADTYYEKKINPSKDEDNDGDDKGVTDTKPITGKGKVNTKGSNLNVRKGPGTNYDKIGKLKNNSSITLTGYKDKWYQIDYNGKEGYVSASYITTSDKKKLPAFDSGGLVDFTGPAWVDGSKSRPEAFLSAEDTAMLKSKIFSNSDGSLRALVAALEAITSDTSRYSAQTNTESIIIQNAQVNIQPGIISNDYDARRAGEMALEEMVKIARKTTNRVVSR